MSAANVLTGAHFVGVERAAGAGASFRAVDAARGVALEPSYFDAEDALVASACERAAGAEDAYASTEGRARAAFLRRIAAEIAGLGDALVDRVALETALPIARIQTERARTMFQLETFARAVEEGSWVDARIDRADRERKPQPKPDLRAMLRPIGPVAVFGASNFPLAYSVAGGDTASALAVGCPVVVKAHPMHPGTSELVATAIAAAVRATGMPDGVFSMVHGRGHEVGAALVRHSAIAAVGFTGSFAGGSALCRLASARETPIPVFAEMGSVNPVVVLPAALAQRGATIGQAVASSSLLACGQFCTSPGMVLYCDGAGAEDLVEAIRSTFAASPAGVMVHADIRSSYERAAATFAAQAGVRLAAEAAEGDASAPARGRGRVFATDAASTLRSLRLREELYGPALLLVRCRDVGEMEQVVAAMHGHLTATVHGDEADLQQHARLLRSLEKRVGRIVHNGVPTGVEVCAAMQHGGPWPASSDSRFTAVGPRAILRWVRPVAWQDAPQHALPSALRDGNPLGIARTIDGEVGRL